MENMQRQIDQQNHLLSQLSHAEGYGADRMHKAVGFLSAAVLPIDEPKIRNSLFVTVCHLDNFVATQAIEYIGTLPSNPCGRLPKHP